MAKSKENERILKENSTKVILNVPNDIAEKFKDLAIKRGITRSSMIIYAMSWYLDYNTSLDLMPKMIDVLKSAELLTTKKERELNNQ